MLTPVDIQQKKFHVGLGYDKKDVNTFFDEVVKSYEQLYRSNAELKDQLSTLNDTLQNYKSKEATLEKSILLAEKDSEDTKSRANKEAKTIELEAKNKAKIILQDAEKRLEEIKTEVAVLETQYAAYKTNFCNLMKRQFEFLKEEDFDADSYIDEKALGVLIGATPSGGGSAGGASFGSFSGDPQMRDESSLGGMASGNRDDLTSTSAVYTANLSEGENFVDPFNPNKSNGRYNPFDESSQKKDKEKDGEKKQTFTVNTGKNRSRNNSSTVRQFNQPTNSSAGSTSNVNSTPKYESKQEVKSEPIPEAKPEVKPEVKPDVKPDIKPEVKPEPTTQASAENKPQYGIGNYTSASKTEEEGPIPTVSFGDMDSVDSNLSGDIEMTIGGKALLGDEFDDSETDEFGFEFI